MNDLFKLWENMPKFSLPPPAPKKIPAAKISKKSWNTSVRIVYNHAHYGYNAIVCRLCEDKNFETKLEATKHFLRVKWQRLWSF